MPNLKYKALSTYKSNTYIHLDVKSSNTQAANTHTHTHTHLHTCVLFCPLGLSELQACPFSDVVFTPIPLSALSSFPFHCA